MSCSAEADEFVSPLRGSIRFCRLPRADALGYLLNAPPALGYLVHGDLDRPCFH